MKQSAKFPKFKKRLNDLLKERNESVTEFAKTIGISRQTAGFYLNGDRIPDAKNLAQICTACNVSSDYLLWLSDDPNRKPSAIDDFGLSKSTVEILSRSPSGNPSTATNALNTILGTESGVSLLVSICAFLELQEAHGEIVISNDGEIKAPATIDYSLLELKAKKQGYDPQALMDCIDTADEWKNYKRKYAADTLTKQAFMNDCMDFLKRCRAEYRRSHKDGEYKAKTTSVTLKG